jgi:chloride channel 3/4/5
LSACAAAGIAVAFASPIGGVLFSLEEVSYYFPPKTMFRAFFCAVTAALTLKVISLVLLFLTQFLNPNGSGKIVLFEVSYQRADWRASEMIIFVFLGVVMGIYGALFCKFNMLWTRTFRQLKVIKRWPLLEVGLVSLLTATVIWYNPYTRTMGVRIIEELFSECADDRYNGACSQQVENLPHLIKLLGMAVIVKAFL